MATTIRSGAVSTSMTQDLQRARALTALLLLVPGLAVAQNEGTFDPAFAGGGHFVFGYLRSGNPVEVKENFNTLAVDADDRIVVAGACFAGSAFPPCAARHQPDGGADTTFGDVGDGLMVFGSNGQYMTDSFVQADGSTVVCGSFNNGITSVALVGRLTPQGLPDTSAAGAPSGIRAVNFPSGTSVASGRCAPGPASSTYVVATVNGSAGGGTLDVAVARLDDELQLDPAFSDDGFATAAVDLAAVNSEFVGDVAVAPDGGPVLVGADSPVYSVPSSSDGWIVCALLADGTPRAGFGASGCRVYKRPFDLLTGNEFAASAVAFDMQQRILVAGSTAQPGSSHRGGVARFLLDGTPDPTFNGGTYQVLPAGNISANLPPTAVLGMPGGRIVAAGPIQPGGFFTEQISVSAILEDGSGPDPTFGNGGLTLVTDGVNRYLFGSMVLQGDRPLITGRIEYASDTSNGLLVRLRGDQLLIDGFE